MSIKDIVFHLDTSETARSVSDFAISLAATTGAHLTAAGISIQYFGTGGFEDAGGIEYLLEITEESRKAAEAAYKSLAASTPAGVQTEFVMVEAVAGIARDRFGALARHFDLSIVGQGASETGSEDRLMAAGALFGSGRPVFVVPSTHAGPAKLARAMVCWDGGVAAARALAGALPLLEKASVVEVVSISQKEKHAEELPGFNIARHLARHGVEATLCNLSPSNDAGAALLAHAVASGADYMVMGGYGHWRLRELMLGGATRTVLASMTLPVLMSH